MQKLGMFWKIHDICCNMGTKIFKMEEDLTEKMKRDIKGVHIVSSEFCQFLEGGLATLSFIFSVISYSILKISVPIL